MVTVECIICRKQFKVRQNRSDRPNGPHCSRECVVNDRKRRPDTLVERFWKYVKKTDKCWEWTSNRLPKGYGVIGNKGKMCYAHRLSWMIHNGPIPVGLLVCHHCDNPKCVHPDHLFLGTYQDNVDDAKKKGRTTKGRPRRS